MGGNCTKFLHGVDPNMATPTLVIREATTVEVEAPPPLPTPAEPAPVADEVEAPPPLPAPAEPPPVAETPPPAPAPVAKTPAKPRMSSLVFRR